MIDIKRLIFITVIFFLTVATSPVYAQNTLEPVNSKKISGGVIRTDEHRLVIRTSDGLSEWTIPSGVKIENQIFPFISQDKISAIQSGDKITLTLNQNGEVVLVQLVPKTLSNLINWGIPLLIAVLTGFLTLRFFKPKTSRDFIKTSATSSA